MCSAGRTGGTRETSSAASVLAVESVSPYTFVMIILRLVSLADNAGQLLPVDKGRLHEASDGFGYNISINGFRP